MGGSNRREWTITAPPTTKYAELVYKHINAQLRKQKAFLASQTRLSEGFHEFIYESQVMTDVVRQAKMVANADISVSITGETGTGKGLIAQYIHQMSNRKDALFVKVNCPSLNKLCKTIPFVQIFIIV